MREQLEALKSFIPKPKRYTTIVMMLIILAGFAGSVFAAISENLHNREFLEGRAAVIADALPLNDIALLKGDKSDLTSPAYLRVKDRLQQIRRHNQDLRYVYLMGKRSDGTTFFYADSEQANSDGYSPPGKIYSQASTKLKSVFYADQPFVEGPVRDNFGVWVSALAPVTDTKTGNIIAVAGIDTPAGSYYFNILVYALIPLCLAAIPFAGLLRDRKLEAKEWEITNLKNQFVSIASHELRSPINGMLWAIQSLIKPTVTNMTENQHELLTDMFHSAESSVATINEILDMSAFEHGTTLLKELEHETVDIRTIISEVTKTLSLGAQQKRLSVVVTPNWPQHVYTNGDLTALKRIFMNVVSNAIKYSYGGTQLTIDYQVKDNMHHISVADQGIGIPAKEQDKVLQGYYRAKNATKAQVHGTGMGLLLTRLIAEEHGGTVSVKSKEAVGTTVTVSLPVATAPIKSI